MTEAGIIFVVILISSAGILAGKRVRSSSDFLTANGQASTLLTTGAFLSIIGSQSTIGTAQLAFTFGLSAWWFTLGSALGLAAFAVFYALPLRRSGRTTQFQLIADEYGQPAKKFGAILCTTGTFISVIAQVTACIGFITALYPSITLFHSFSLDRDYDVHVYRHGRNLGRRDGRDREDGTALRRVHGVPDSGSGERRRFS